MSERTRIGRPRRIDERLRDAPTVAPAPDLPDNAASLPDSGPSLPHNAASLPHKAAGPITADTPMRAVGDAPRSAWEATLPAASPLRGELDAVLRSASPHGALALVQALRESSGGTAANARATRNAWGLMVRGSNPSRLQAFGSWAEAAAEFARRLSDPAPPYDPAGISLWEFFLTYVGGPLCRATEGKTCANGESRESIRRYAEAAIADLNRFTAGAEPKPDPWRPYPMPKHRRLIVQKPYEGAGFDRVAFRGPRINAFGTHITAGGDPGGVEFWQRFFGTGGERAADALVDAVIDRDGTIAILNDPFSQTEGGTRAGWANGGVDGLEGEGVAYYRASPAINSTIFSCEHVAAAGQAWTDAMIEASVELRVWLMQRVRVPAAAYPTNPKTGATAETEHFMFAVKSCPDFPYRDKLRPVVRAEVKKRLTAWQGGSAPLPAPEPVKRYTDWGLTLDQVAYYFGTLRRFNEDGTTDDLPFDPAGPVSLAWLKRCEERGVWPEAEELRVFDAAAFGRPTWFASFEGGWVLVKTAGDTRDAWKWLDEVRP